MARTTEPDGYLLLGAAETVVGLSDSFKPMPERRGLYVLSGVGPKAAAAVVVNLNPQRLVAASGR